MDVSIVPVGDVPARVKRQASAALRDVYDCAVTVRSQRSIPEDAYDERRNQYRAESFIDLAERATGRDAGPTAKAIALTTADLFYRRRNYVFGLAYLDGSGCVVSTHRLNTEADGGFSERSATDIFADRIQKEVVHELGHTVGLEHCDNGRCVMNFSATVQDVDRKEPQLCGSCRREVL
ncbi:MAG: archaemetzincin family Zn-dependent metalloprotease [Halobacteriaceae archaeon]